MPAPPSRQTVICLDDDPLSLRLVEHLLQSRFHVVSCATLQQTVEAFYKYPTNIFLCDYHLGNGLTATHAWEILAYKYGFNPIHRILITSYPSPTIERETLGVGFNRVFSKPLHKEFKKYCLDLWTPQVSDPNAPASHS